LRIDFEADSFNAAHMGGGRGHYARPPGETVEESSGFEEREGIVRQVCSVLVLALLVGAPVVAAPDHGHDGGGAIVPDSSLESPFDIGVSSHTNHLIRINPALGSGPSGTVLPSDLRTYYKMPSSGGTGAIAVVVAFHYANALYDFNLFSSLPYIGLRQEKSTNPTAKTNQVFQVVYATGYRPRSNSGWSQEAALDIEWSHAMAPGAKIFLVEAASNQNSDLLTAVQVASALPGVQQVSMSWGGSEFSTEANNDSYFITPNSNTANTVCFFAASGDTGGQVIWPSVSSQVVAAGGTSLNFDPVTGKFTGESGWSGSGGGVSQYVPMPSWQKTSAGSIPPAPSDGTHRCVPDLSSDADPNTGVLVVWNGGGYIFGGTSVASPCLAGMANLSGVSKTTSNTFLTDLYSRYVNKLNPCTDIKGGSAGSFSAVVGWDFVTGVGSPWTPASVGP
jgi:subtilase family serine protease